MNARLLVAVVLGGCLVSAITAYAELSPEMYRQLKSDAQEVYLLRVTKVERSESPEPGVTSYLCRAEIATVERTKVGRQPGDVTQFRSYHVPRRRGFAGPQSPPLLRAGWTGRVYLNASQADKPLELAAFGQSFQRRAIPRVPVRSNSHQGRLGIRYQLGQDGRMQVLRVEKGSLAERIGLQPGDRIVTINRAPVSNASDVRETLNRDKKQVAVEIVRNARSLELTISR